MPDEKAAAGTEGDRASPRTIEEVADAVRQAGADRIRLRITGAGTWPDGGAPVSAGRALDLSGLRGITEYVPGDLTLTARAGTSLAEIANATGEHGQWLPLDPFGDKVGTLGATLATASAGPLAGSIGLPRDVALGVTFVPGDGAVVQGGGRVVKNVAGFDLVRMTVGAWGTLGAIVEATVRLRARPEADETVALGLPPEQEELRRTLSSVRLGGAVEPLAAELVSPALASRLGLAAEPAMLLRVAGNRTAVRHQVASLRTLGTCRETPASIWEALRLSDPPGAMVIRVSRRPSELARLWAITMSLPDVDAHATLARGIVRLRLRNADQAAVLSAFEPADRRVRETLAAHQLLAGRPEGAPRVSDGLSSRLRLAFDPLGILNRGVLGEEAA